MKEPPKWRVSDAFWTQVAPLVPPAPSHEKGGRPRMPDRPAFEAIIFVLRTGIQWKALPRELGAASTVHDRFQEWERAGFFQALWQAGLTAYDEVAGLDWTWQAVDGVMTKAPFGGAATGAHPTDRGKSGVKRSLLTDGAGIPLAVVVAGANRPDLTLLAVTLDGIVVARPTPHADSPGTATPVPGRGLRLRAHPGAGGGARLHRPHPATRGGAPPPGVRPRLPGTALGGRAHA